MKRGKKKFLVGSYRVMYPLFGREKIEIKENFFKKISLTKINLNFSFIIYLFISLPNKAVKKVINKQRTDYSYKK